MENYRSSLSARSKETLSQVFISVKTTSRYHYPRLVILLETWASLVPDTTWFFTDTAGDPELVRRTGGRLVATNCSSSHHRSAQSGVLQFLHRCNSNMKTALILGHFKDGQF